MASQGFRTNDESISAVKNDLIDELLKGVHLEETMNLMPFQSFPRPAEDQSSLECLNYVPQNQANPVQRDYFPLWNYFPSSVSLPSSSSTSNNPFHLGSETNKSCEACGTRSTPEWRKGPDGRKTLCNACGLRFSRNRDKQRKKEKKEREAQIKLLLSRQIGNKANKEMVEKFDQLPKTTHQYNKKKE